MNQKNLTYHRGRVSRSDREAVTGQRGCVVWLTGLSGSGKSTIAHAAEARLVERGRLTYVLDGDNIRHGLNSDLGFSPEARVENIRRIGEVAALFADSGILTLVAFIAPYAVDRDRVRQKVGSDRFIEVFVDAPVAVCESRDPKGLYRKARAGEIGEFTGISAPYEEPVTPDLRIRTDESSIDQSVDALCALLESRGIIPSLREDPSP